MVGSSSPATIILQISIFLFTFPPTFCNFLPSQTLVFPLQTQNFPHRLSAASSSSDKLSFQHNVSLTVSLAAGSPPSMVLDTGSELSWLHCKKAPNLRSVFDPARSSSYLPVPCSRPDCATRTRDLHIPPSCDPKTKLCHVAISYADASSIEGNLARDTFVIGSKTRPGTLFGCMDSGSSSTSEEDGKTTGLMGMNRGALSFVNQMGLSRFSYCISGLDSTGVLILGDARFSWLGSLKYTPLVLETRPLPYFDRVAYTVRLEGIRVGSKLLPLPKSAFVPDHTGAGQTMVDSGTQFTFLLGPVYTALRTEFLKQTEGVLRVVDDPNFVFQGAMDLCYRVESGQPDYKSLPDVNLIFNGAEMRVSGQKLLYRVNGSGGNNQVYCFTFGNSDLLGMEAFVIGHHHQQNLWMEYDLANSRVGFAEVKCDLASQRLLSRV
ncbi:PREDICTED: aspartic proteinase PCS1-like [Tarenaya hassleriana]|uniref:aspartic proteinase PCS1-like n=1 Tax=Tarenaya hassleriana TaxID=28532 RepID=UPI00053C503E|nr:PREDICTED: aspartic proteinase PCS1-like [Tarenaya hassleriana]